MTPNVPKPRFWAKFHLGMVVIFYFSQNSTRPWPRPNLEQARGSTWTRHGAQPGPGTGPNLDQGRVLQHLAMAVAKKENLDLLQKEIINSA